MTPGRQRVFGRLAVELRADPTRGPAQVWLDPSLHDLGATLTTRVDRVDDPERATVVVVHARRVAVDGTIEQVERGPAPSAVVAGPGAPRDGLGGPKVIAVALLEADPPDRIVATCRGARRAQLVLCELAVMEVARDGLIIVELAKGVSARDLQARVEPSLLVSPRVKEMTTTPPPAIVE